MSVGVTFCQKKRKKGEEKKQGAKILYGLKKGGQRNVGRTWAGGGGGNGL